MRRFGLCGPVSVVLATTALVLAAPAAAPALVATCAPEFKGPGTVAPGTVVAYERNGHANANLREHGIEVLTAPASELAIGTAAALWREAVGARRRAENAC